MATKLDQLAARFFHGGNDYTPNREAAHEIVIIDWGAALNEFLVEYQLAGGDIAEFSDDDWETMLTERFLVPEDELATALERIASYGVVDNDWWLEEGL